MLFLYHATTLLTAGLLRPRPYMHHAFLNHMCTTKTSRTLDHTWAHVEMNSDSEIILFTLLYIGCLYSNTASSYIQVTQNKVRSNVISAFDTGPGKYLVWRVNGSSGLVFTPLHLCRRVGAVLRSQLPCTLVQSLGVVYTDLSHYLFQVSLERKT